MLNKFLFIVSFIFIATPYFRAQRIIDPQNCRDGESVEYCHQHVHLNELLKDPVFKKQYEKDQKQLKMDQDAFKMSKAKGDIPSKNAIFRIPVVFHVLHNNGPEKISKAQIMDALDIMNRDYSLQNADANNVFGPWQGVPADVQVEFVLATKAPDGTCFGGITYTVDPITSNGDSGSQQVNVIKAKNDVYQGEWPGNRYLNIFICEEIGGAAGYTYLPGSQGASMKNGIWVLSHYVGSIGTGSILRSRTLTHEAGHWLGLPHVWGGTNNPGIASNCSNFSDDGIDDTPQTIGNTSCFLSANTCDLDNAYWGFDQIDNVENYMEYSYCSKMFTPGQATLMQGTLTSGVGGRSTVVSAQNLAIVGADSNLVLCAADFSSDATEVCVGSTVTFQDDSYNGVQSWNWSFPGGTPATSTSSTPSVTYSTPGNYTVTLTASDGTGNTSTESKTSFITVLPAGISLPYVEGFESYTNLNDANSFWRAENNGGNAFSIFSGTGSEGTKCVRLRNFNQGDDQLDELVSNNFDLSSMVSPDVVTFSFKYAYRKRNAANQEILRVLASKDCGQTWNIRRTLSGNTLSSLIETAEWTPSASDFVQVHVTGVNSTYFLPNVQMKFTFTSDGGNNLYIDQINFYKGGPASLGLDEVSFSNLTLFPNPTENELNLRFDIAESAEVVLSLKDLTGKAVKSYVVNATSGENLVLMETSEMASGMYFLHIETGNSTKTMQFVVK